MEVKRSGFYAWLRRGPSLRARHDSVLSAHTRTVFQGSRRTYESPRVRAELASLGVRTSKRRVERLMHNPKRRHSTLGFLSPIDYEKRNPEPTSSM